METKPNLSRLPTPAARWGRRLAFATLVGVLSGTGAAGVEWGLHAGTDLLVGRIAHLGGADVARFDWRVLLLPALGGLLSGLFVQALFRQPFGHGTDLLTRAFHHNLGDLPLKGPAVKAAAAVGVLSCGGSAGPEGPIAALGAAIGSTTSKVLRLSPRERRILLVAGCAAGIGAIFRCPLGAALFAAGVLYREPEFEADSIVPGFVASVIGYSTFSICWGFGEPLLAGANTLRFQSPIELLAYAPLGLLCGATAIFFSLVLSAIQERIVPRTPAPRWLLPAIGGLLTGAVACLLPQVMDGRYLFVRNAMGGMLFVERPEVTWWWWAGLFGAIVVGKCVATGFTVGSGASGGVLGPSVFIGGAVGAFWGAVLEAALPGGIPESLRQSLIPVGMAGVLAAGMRTPLSAIIMVAEMTGSYGLFVPLMLVCVSAYIVGRDWGLNHEQVRSAADSPAHALDGVIHYLEAWSVGDLMESNWKARVGPDATLGEMVRGIEPGTRPVFAVVRDGALCGVVSMPDIQRIMNEPGLAEAVIAQDIMTERVVTLRAKDDLYHALSEFGRTRHDVIPVVSDDGSRRWLGMLTRRHVFETLQRHVANVQQVVMREHAGLRAVDQEGQLQQMVMAVSPVETQRIQRLMVPLDALGKSIRQADMRKNFGLHVVGIELPDGTIQFPPDLDLTLMAGHRLVAMSVDEPPKPSGGSLND